MQRRIPPWSMLILLACFAFAAAMQIPIAWTWAALHTSQSYSENSTHLDMPGSISDPPAKLTVTNNHYTGVRWITVTRWTPGSDLPRATRSNSGEPYDSNPAYPLSTDHVFAGLTDASAWPTLPPGIVPPGNVQFVEVVVLGLPFPCVYGRMMSPPGSTRPLMENLYWFRGRTWLAWPRRGDPLILPYRPIWSGFILNTLLMGLPLFLLAMIPGRVRRALRRRRGLCIRCAYDLRATPAGSPCSECGHNDGGGAS